MGNPVWKNDLLLLDAGFYSCRTFRRIRARKAHFIIPATIKMRPKVLRTLGPGDYLCCITDSENKTSLEARADIIHGLVSPYDVSPDCQRFLLIVPIQSAPVPLTLIQNWKDYLER